MHGRFLFRGFKTSREILDNNLGALERQVMAFVWSEGETSVREACERLDSTIAYTTVMTTMDRLFKKGLLSRRKAGRAFVYSATATQRELEGAVAVELVQSLLVRSGREPLPILSSLVDAVSDRDRALLDDLERLVREKRRVVKGR
jgi:predicted transcriptional regulator